VDLRSASSRTRLRCATAIPSQCLLLLVIKRWRRHCSNCQLRQTYYRSDYTVLNLNDRRYNMSLPSWGFLVRVT